MTPGSLSFAAQEWFWPALIFFAAGIFFIFRSYAGTSLPPGKRLAALLLKALALALLLAILLEPTWTTTRPREGANLFAVVADNSMGLELRDPGQARTRGQILRDTLASDQTAWQARLEETFVVRRYRFDARLESARDFAELDFRGRSSTLGGALRSVAERFQGQPLAGVLLFTDGNATDLDGGFETIPGLPPVYPVILGENSEMTDLALSGLSASQTVFEDSPVTLAANLRASGFAGQKISAQVRLEGKVVSEQTVQPGKQEDEIPLRFQLKPEAPGLSFYELRVAAADAMKSGTNSSEATEYNNSRFAAVDRGRGPHRILYVGGRPDWEYKFLNRAVSEDPEVQLVGLIRIARREPKFTFRGRTGESSNPLFRGFNKTTEETERYDQPVLIRLNTKDEDELRGGFPKIAEDLYGYEGIIFDDVEAEFFTADQQLLVQRYVSERGGGFLMLGGVDSLQDGKYYRTPVGEMLPVYLDRLPEEAAGARFKLELTREGWLQPWVRLRGTEHEEQSRLDAAPGFMVLNELREVKPGASVLATLTDNTGRKFPAVAFQRFGNGRAATVAIGDLWRNGLASEQGSVDLAKGWRQMLRWLISDVPRQCEIQAVAEESSAGGLEGAMRLVVRVRDKKFEPLENAEVQITVAGPSIEGKTNVVQLKAEASGREPGEYFAAYAPREPGAYRAAAAIKDSAGVKLDDVEAGWVSDPLAKEFASLKPNRSLLEEIARKTGGQTAALDGVEALISGLKNKKAPIVETYSYPLWHTPWIFLAALGCMIAEWGLRRWRGLA